MKYICSIKDCNNAHKAKGYCQKHYTRLWKYGDPLFKKTEEHGLSKTKEYRVWCGIKARCLNKNNPAYKYYGGRGIKICDEWINAYTTFYKDMGSRPFPDAVIDRIDNNGNYEPGNCRWITQAENMRNTSRGVLNWFTVKSIRKLFLQKKYSYKELSKIYNIQERTIKSVIQNQTWKEEQDTK